VAAAAEAALRPAPGIGEHGRAILAELGITDEAIGRLGAAGVLRLPEMP
jgi:crotonobetainyl-CoA:carnitine CoA-transferase CaiB-like acyl-CoA transferase